MLPWLVRDFIRCWNKIPVRKTDRNFKTAALCCLMWVIWKEYDTIVFKDAEFSLNWMKSEFIHAMWSWASVNTRFDSLLVENLFLLVRV